MNDEDEAIKNSDNKNNTSGSVPMAGLPLAGAMMGLCLGGPVGVLAGVKLGGVAALGGSILGYTGASVIKEQKDMRKHIDDHYKNEPKLYVLTPKEEAQLSRRRNSLRSNQAEPVRQQHPCVRRSQSESPRHLPSVRSKRACYRSSRTLSESRSYQNSANTNNSPVTRRRTESFNHDHYGLHHDQRSHHHDQRSPHLRFGDLSLEEKRSVITLIRQRQEQDQHQQQSPRRSTRRRLPTTDGSYQMKCYNAAENKRRVFARQQSRRASSLPDVLEEDSLSNKS